MEIRYHGSLKQVGGGWSVSRGSLDLFRPSVQTTPVWELRRDDYLSQYRFDTFEGALSAARAVVDKGNARGITWAQWRERQQQEGKA